MLKTTHQLRWWCPGAWHWLCDHQLEPHWGVCGWVWLSSCFLRMTVARNLLIYPPVNQQGNWTSPLIYYSRFHKFTTWFTSFAWWHLQDDVALPGSTRICWGGVPDYAKCTSAIHSAWILQGMGLDDRMGGKWLEHVLNWDSQHRGLQPKNPWLATFKRGTTLGDKSTNPSPCAPSFWGAS